MKVLFDGIYTLFSGSALATSLTNRMYFVTGRQGGAYPYCVYGPISNVNDLTFTETAENTVIQFDLFDDGNDPTNILAYFEQLKTIYDNATITVSGFNHIMFYREEDFLSQDIDETDKLFWQLSVQYRCAIQKNR